MSTILPVELQRAWKPGLRWFLSFVGFPLAGVAARAAAGPIDSMSAAVVGGVAGGAVLGAVQAVALPEGSPSRRLAWAAATTVGLGAGLALGAGVIDYQTDTSSLVTMGACAGAGVGIAQASVADMSAGRRVAWAMGTPLLWALGWFITSNVIVDAERQHAMFGSSGAIVVSVLSALLLILPATRNASGEAAANAQKEAVLS